MEWPVLAALRLSTPPLEGKVELKADELLIVASRYFSPASREQCFERFRPLPLCKTVPVIKNTLNRNVLKINVHSIKKIGGFFSFFFLIWKDVTADRRVEI